MITTTRNQFTGTHLTQQVKDRLKELANKTNKSMSAKIAQYIEDGLDREAPLARSEAA